jgi:tetratricopeptide (TPR) repeat protein
MANMQLSLALELARKAALSQEEASSLRNLGIVFARSGDYTQADRHLQEALARYLHIGDRQGQTSTLNAMGVFAAEQGDFETARDHFENTLSVYREIGDRWGEGAALSNLGQVCVERGNYADARPYLEQALELCVQIDDREGEGTILNNLGQMANEQGDYGAAKEYLERAAAIMGEIGNTRTLGFALANLGLVRLLIGDRGVASQHFKQSLKLLRIIDDPQWQSLVLVYDALRLHHLGEDEAARDTSQEALMFAENVGDLAAQASALTILGHALTALDAFENALQAYQRALDIRNELDQNNLATEPLAGLAQLSLIRGDMANAMSYVEDLLLCLNVGRLDGTLEPLRVFVICVQVLQTQQDDRAAEILDRAILVLNQQAYRIREPALKEKFFASQYAVSLQDFKGDERSSNDG